MDKIVKLSRSNVLGTFRVASSLKIDSLHNSLGFPSCREEERETKRDSVIKKIIRSYTMHPLDPAKEARKPSATSHYPDQISDTTAALAAAKVISASLRSNYV